MDAMGRATGKINVLPGPIQILDADRDSFRRAPNQIGRQVRRLARSSATPPEAAERWKLTESAIANRLRRKDTSTWTRGAAKIYKL